MPYVTTTIDLGEAKDEAGVRRLLADRLDLPAASLAAATWATLTEAFRTAILPDQVYLTNADSWPIGGAIDPPTVLRHIDSLLRQRQTLRVRWIGRTFYRTFRWIGPDGKERRLRVPIGADNQIMVGIPGSGAAIELDEPALAGHVLAIQFRSNHVVLTGTIARDRPVPDISFTAVPPHEPFAWKLTPDAANGGHPFVERFDSSILHIGAHRLQFVPAE